MHSPTYTCVFNNDPSSDETLAQAFGAIPDVQVIRTVSHWDDIHAVLEQEQVHAVVVNLDPDVDFGLNVVRRIVQFHPDMGVIGISKNTDPVTIISAMRTGCTQFVCSPIDTDDLTSALDRIRHTRFGAAAQKCHRTCVVGSSGGAGATTIACNLAMELAQIVNRRVGLVDLNLEFGDVACALDCEPKYSLADLCRAGGAVDTTMVDSAIHDLPCDVSILARPEKVEDALLVSPEGVEQALTAMSTMYPHIVVDLPRSFSFLSAAALNGTDTVLIVTQLNVSAIRNATRVYNWLREMGAAESCVEIVLNRCRAEFERITPDDIERHFSRPIFGMVPNDYRRVMASRDLGHPIHADAPTSTARMAIHELAKKIAIVGPKTNGDEAKAKPAGLFKRFLGKK